MGRWVKERLYHLSKASEANEARSQTQAVWTQSLNSKHYPTLYESSELTESDQYY